MINKPVTLKEIGDWQSEKAIAFAVTENSAKQLIAKCNVSGVVYVVKLNDVPMISDFDLVKAIQYYNEVEL